MKKENAVLLNKFTEDADLVIKKMEDFKQVILKLKNAKDLTVEYDLASELLDGVIEFKLGSYKQREELTNYVFSLDEKMGGVSLKDLPILNKG